MTCVVVSPNCMLTPPSNTPVDDDIDTDGNGPYRVQVHQARGGNLSLHLLRACADNRVNTVIHTDFISAMRC